MTARHTLLLDALGSAFSAGAVLLFAADLAPLFGLGSPLVLDVVAMATLGYAGVVFHASRRRVVTSGALMGFAIANAMWVAGSAVLLAACWQQFAPLARLLVVAVALVVEVFATLQYRAAGAVRARRGDALAAA